MKYIIVYLPYHDYSLPDSRVFDSLESAQDAVMTKKHDHYEYENVVIYEILLATLRVATLYDIDSDNAAHEIEDTWDLIYKE